MKYKPTLKNSGTVFFVPVKKPTAVPFYNKKGLDK
jgi:hypothetical protein